MKPFNRIPSLVNQGNHSAWLWLLLGLLLMPFAAWQTVIPLAAWLAPIFLLRFSRTSKRALVALPLIFVVYEFGNWVSARGFEFNLLGLLGNQLFKALLWMLPYAVDRLVGSRLKAWARVLIFPTAFVTVDWVMSLLRVSSSGSPAYSQFDNRALLQIVSMMGMWGVTFLIMWCASTVNALWEHHWDWRPMRGQLGVFVGILLVVLLFGSIRLALGTPDSPAVQVATITSDSTLLAQATSSIAAPDFIRSPDAERAAARPYLQPLADQMLARTETALRGGAKIVSWDEEAAFVLAEDEQSTLDRAALMARQYDAYLQVSLGVLTRTQALPFLRDLSILIDPTGQVLWTYDKSRLVPFDEAFFTIAGPGILPVANTPYGRLSTAICYETYYPALIRQAGQNGVDILITPSNDTRMYAESAAAIAQVRAVENGVALVRAAHGLTLITDYEGRVLGSQDYFTNSSGGILLTTVPTRGVTTLYSRIGDVFAYLCAVGLIFLTGWAIIRRERPAAIPGHLPA